MSMKFIVMDSLSRHASILAPADSTRNPLVLSAPRQQVVWATRVAINLGSRPMKNTQKCPKCESDDILKIPGDVGPWGSGNNIAVALFTRVLVTRYLCCECGFS